MRQLHIGGHKKAAGWEVLDALPAPHVDHVCNAKDLSRFPDATFDTLYASHVLEHFDYSGEIFEVLEEWRRVLVPGGLLYVSVPDMDVLSELFLDKRLTTEERFHVMRMVFGGHADQYDYHLVGLNNDLLNSLLREAGYANIRRVEKLDMFDDSSCMRFKDRLISLNMIAAKPVAG